ncbi:MAG: RHS repeat-associated core domain-containing protein [Xanthomarina gelatinilytica]|uniref:RHS repeat-associated core domain-containing protein n=1 Tax=Xanthomarina gelatinilytica TaxID=1137281 RepID=UPI003A8C64D3
MKDGTNALSLTNASDYFPGGMAMPNRNVEGGYRYGYQGGHAEKEGELGQGINSFELRLWDSRIGRWLTPDPYKQHASLYLGMGNNPINGIDVDGGIFILKGLTKEQKAKWREYVAKIRSTRLGRLIYDTVENSPHEVNVVWRHGTDKLNGRLGDFFFADDEKKIMGDEKTYLSFSDRLSVYEENALELEKKHGGSDWRHPEDVALGHEIYHAYQFITNSDRQGINRELDAVKFQNYLYKSNGGTGTLRNGYLKQYGEGSFTLHKIKGRLDLPFNFYNLMFNFETIIIPQRMDNFPGRSHKRIKSPRYF